MQHVVKKALTHAGNHRHGKAANNQGRGVAPKAADAKVLGRQNPIDGGR